MFSFLEVKGLEYHNNSAERGLRNSVVMRKITGGNRSEEGARAHEVIMSLMQSWRMQGKNFFNERMQTLRGELLNRASND